MSAAENTPDREAAVRACVEQAIGGRVLRIEPIAAGLGLRRFLRVHVDRAPGTLVARLDAPEDPAGRPAGVPPEPPLEPIRALLEREDLPVPRRFGSDAARGIELLEDLGTRTLEDAARSPEERDALYPAVLALLPRLQRIAPAPGVAAFERRLDRPLLAYKADLFVTHGLPAALGRPATRAERRVVLDAFERIASVCEDAPQRLAHRDLQSRNVLVRDGRPYWIDLQGAFLAPPEYDVVSLLRDSYVTLPEERIARWSEDLRPALPDAPEAELFALRCDLLAIARKAKDHGRFAYVARERGDAAVERHLGPTAAQLQRVAGCLARRDASYASLADLLSTLPGGPACAR